MNEPTVATPQNEGGQNYFTDITPKPERPLNRKERSAWAAAVRRATRKAKRRERRRTS